MKLLKFYKILIFITILSLIYIHLQMKIFDFAYQGKNKEKQIVELSEHNGAVAYKILEVTSANHLGGYLLAEDSGLKFQDSKSVIQLVTAESVNEEELLWIGKSKKSNNLLANLLSFGSEAEARIDSPDQILKPWRRGQ